MAKRPERPSDTKKKKATESEGAPEQSTEVLSGEDILEITKLAQSFLKKDGQNEEGPVSVFLTNILMLLTMIGRIRNRGEKAEFMKRTVAAMFNKDMRGQAVLVFRALGRIHDELEDDIGKQIVEGMDTLGLWTPLGSFNAEIAQALQEKTDTTSIGDEREQEFQIQLSQGLPYEHVVSIDSHRNARIILETGEVDSIIEMLFDQAKEQPEISADLYKNIEITLAMRVGHAPEGKSEQFTENQRTFLQLMRSRAQKEAQKAPSKRNPQIYQFALVILGGAAFEAVGELGSNRLDHSSSKLH